MNLTKRVKAVFAKPERKLAEIMPELRQLRDTIEWACVSQDTLVEIVDFFDEISKWQDRGISDIISAFEEANYGQYDEVLEKLRALQEHFQNAGRSEYGWNRTKPGEIVTTDNVFLGDIWGLFTHPVSFWQEKKDEPKGGWGGALDCEYTRNRNSYQVVSDQAESLMSPHRESIISIINDLEKVVVA